jgi:transcription elongation factor GreA
MTRLPVTAAGHVALEEELRHRIRVARPCLVGRIQQAISDEANLVENSEYQAALAEQQLNETRIADLEDKLARAEIVDVSKLSGDTIKFGATVTLIDDDTGEKRIWQIVGEPEANPSEGKISVTSPIARALIGKTKGTTVLVDTPGGTKAYKVRHVEWFEDKRKKRKQFSQIGRWLPGAGHFGVFPIVSQYRSVDWIVQPAATRVYAESAPV